MKNTILLSLLTLLIAVLLFLGSKAYDYAVLYEEATTEMVGFQGVSEQAKLQLEKWTKKLLGDKYEDTRKINLDKLREKQKNMQSQALRYTVYFMIILAILLLHYFILDLKSFTLLGSVLAMITLFYGLVSPILMVTIHKEVEYLGDIVLSFESKGIMGSIIKLFETGDIVVAMVILLFSVITPTLKIASLFFVTLFVQSPFAHHLVAFFKMIGKWSMADVFVVAIFLVYLTANKGDVSRAEVEVGLYFFLSYVILSMLVSLSADKLLHEHKLKMTQS